MAVRPDRGRRVAGAVWSLPAIVSPGPVETDSPRIPIDNPDARIAVLRTAHGWLSGVAVLVLRLGARVGGVPWWFATAGRRGRQRQQIRPLAWVAGDRARDRPGDRPGAAVWSRSWRIVFTAFFASIGIGMPLAIQNAVLRHRLYDLDGRVKKTVIVRDRGLAAVAVAGLYLDPSSAFGPWAILPRPTTRRSCSWSGWRTGSGDPGLPLREPGRPPRVRRPRHPLRGAQRVLGIGCPRPTPPTTSCRAWRRSSAKRRAPRPSTYGSSSVASSASRRPGRAAPTRPRSDRAEHGCRRSGTVFTGPRFATGVSCSGRLRRRSTPTTRSTRGESV